MTEKLSPVERALVAAAAMPAPAARKVLMLICESGLVTMPEVPQLTEGQRHYAKREKIINRMQDSIDRICNYVKHETLRNTERHFRKNPPVTSAAAGTDDESKPSSLAARLTFEPQDFRDELLAALREESAAALGVAGQGLYDEIGRDDPFKLPDKQAIKFMDTRENLMSKVPDEIHSDIMTAIQNGLEEGESRKGLMDRIAGAFREVKKTRAKTIAHTETAAAFNFARNLAMKKAGVEYKKWLHSQSPLIKEPRPTHVENDGQIVPVDEPFDISGIKFMYPTDSSLGAGPEDIINCHCVAIPTEGPIGSGDLPGHEFRGNQYTSVDAQNLLRESLTPKAAKFEIPPIKHGYHNFYQFGTITTPLDETKPRLQSKLLHEFGHHVDRVNKMSSSPEFRDVVTKSAERAKNFVPRDTGNVSHISHRISGENEELLRSALLKTPFGQSLQTHGKEYLDKFQHKEVFAIGFGEHQRANTRVKAHFPELYNYMEKNFGE